MNTRFKKISSFLLLNAVGLSAIAWLLVTKDPMVQEGTIYRDSGGVFVFTSPILDYEYSKQGGNKVIPYKKVHERVDQLKNEYGVIDASVYYRDLGNGQWLGVNEKNFFSPASLMKTPLLIAFLKNAEQNPSLLEKKTIASKKYFGSNVEQDILSKDFLVEGETYTLKNIAEKMIQSSDNTAALIIYEQTKNVAVEKVFESVGVVFDKEQGDAIIRVKDFAAFFRVLYNASYLGRDMSELALSLLSQTDFTQGLASGVPKDVVVAHKFGERILENPYGEPVAGRQLHDCGIVYTKNPYILCIMTKGEDFQKQAKFIADVSKFFYENTAK